MPVVVIREILLREALPEGVLGLQRDRPAPQHALRRRARVDRAKALLQLELIAGIGPKVGHRRRRGVRSIGAGQIGGDTERRLARRVIGLQVGLLLRELRLGMRLAPIWRRSIA